MYISTGLSLSELPQKLLYLSLSLENATPEYLAVDLSKDCVTTNTGRSNTGSSTPRHLLLSILTIQSPPFAAASAFRSSSGNMAASGSRA